MRSIPVLASLCSSATTTCPPCRGCPVAELTTVPLIEPPVKGIRPTCIMGLNSYPPSEVRKMDEHVLKSTSIDGCSPALIGMAPLAICPVESLIPLAEAAASCRSCRLLSASTRQFEYEAPHALFATVDA